MNGAAAILEEGDQLAERLGLGGAELRQREPFGGRPEEHLRVVVATLRCPDHAERQRSRQL
jgi:hypothetical protein